MIEMSEAQLVRVVFLTLARSKNFEAVCVPGAGPQVDDTIAVVKTSQTTLVRVAPEDEPTASDDFVTVAEPPPVEERDAFIVQNTPALVDDDPTRFGLVDFLSSKGKSIREIMHTITS